MIISGGRIVHGVSVLARLPLFELLSLTPVVWSIDAIR